MPLSTMQTAEAAAGGAVIDLGLVGRPVGPGGAPGAEGGPEGLPRGWGLLLALGMLLSLVSAVPLPEPPHEVVRQPLRNGAFQLAGGALFVLEHDRTPGPVQAFDAADGRARWTYTPEGLATLTYAAARGDLVVLSPDLCRSGVTGLTVAVDLATGRQRWSASGVPVRTGPGVPGTVVLRSLWSDGCGALAANAPIGGALRWQALDADGGAVWELSAEAGTRVAVDTAEAGATWAALVDRQGVVSVADFVTGARGPTGDLRAGGDDLVAAAGDLLVLVTFDLSGATLSAYRRGSYAAPRWRAKVATSPAYGRSDRFTVRPCGAALCVAGQATAVLDPGSGAVLWSMPNRADLAAVPGGLLTPAGVRPVALLDPATGAPAADLNGWEVLGSDDRRMLMGAPAGEGTLLGLRAGGGVTPIATVDDRLLGCQLDGALVACRTAADEVLLLRLAA